MTGVLSSVQVCVNTDTLFPFSPLVEVCGECEAVLHRECARAATSCPRCGLSVICTSTTYGAEMVNLLES